MAGRIGCTGVGCPIYASTWPIKVFCPAGAAASLLSTVPRTVHTVRNAARQPSQPCDSAARRGPQPLEHDRAHASTLKAEECRRRSRVPWATSFRPFAVWIAQVDTQLAPAFQWPAAPKAQRSSSKHDQPGAPMARLQEFALFCRSIASSNFFGRQYANALPSSTQQETLSPSACLVVSTLSSGSSSWQHVLGHLCVQLHVWIALSAIRSLPVHAIKPPC